MHDVIIWSIIGIFLMFFEIFALPGIGILFTGFSAITVSLMIYLDPSLNDDIAIQLIYFFIYTVIWSALLWWPLKKYIRYSESDDFENAIGSFTITTVDMNKGKLGEVPWSGTKMPAKIFENSPNDYIPPGTRVKIVKIIDGVLFITENLNEDINEAPTNS